MSLKDRLKILVVDDMSTSRGLIVQSLESIGITQIQLAANGPEAMRTLAQRPAHLVISDYNMPDMTGIDLLKQLRGCATTQAIGFILITGRADQSIVEQGKSWGMNNFLRKPFGTQELKSCLEAVTGRL